MSLLMRLLLPAVLLSMPALVPAAETLPEAILKQLPGTQVVFRHLAIKAPDIAENGAVVNIRLRVHALPPSARIRSVRLFKAYRADRPMARFTLPAGTLANDLSFRVKLTKSTDVYAVAELADGTLLAARKHIKITIGGCGGGGIGGGGAHSGGGTPSVTVAPAGPAPARSGAGGAATPQAGLLTAGEIDDNLNFSAFLRFLQNHGRAQIAPVLDDRITLLIRDAHGRPIQQARLRINAVHEHRIATGYSGAQGEFQLFPALLGNGRSTRFDVQVTTAPPAATIYETSFTSNQLDTRRRFEIRLQEARAQAPAKLDLMFVFDTTGSMGDELQYLNQEFRSIVRQVRRRFPAVHMRYGLTLYRDHGDAYVVRGLGFTADPQVMQQRLQEQYADGGGDYPEAMDQALANALQARWRSEADTIKLLFLVADAPPHEQRLATAWRLAQQARRRGIRIFPVAASGVDDVAEGFLRSAAVITQGRYLFLTDDSGIGNPHAEPKIPCYLVTRLDQLLVRTIGSELAGQRLEPAPGEILRRVGIYDNGFCR